MDFSLSETQLRLRDSVLRFARKELQDETLPRDARGEFSRALWQKCAAFGVQGLCVPEDYGGTAQDALTIIVALEALGYGCADNGLLFSLNAQMWSCQMPLVRFGREEQKRRYLPGLCDGSQIGIQAMTEPGSGSDAFSLLATAERKGTVYVLNGSKMFITNAPVADVFVVFAKTAPGKGFAGISAFVVERGTPGLSVSRDLHKMGLRTSPMGEVVLRDCEVPADCLLGPAGAGMAIFNHSMDWERCCIMACAVGTMQRQLERCVQHAKTRIQFGRPIGAYQAVSHRIAEMRIRLETARLLLYKVGWLKSQGKSTAADAAMAKLYISECFVRSSLDAQQIFGGYGYMVEYELEREVRDALGSRIYSGTSDIQKNIIAGQFNL